MGGEKSPDKNLEGANIFLERNKKATDCFFYFFGEESKVKEKISKYKYLKNNYKLFDSKIIVSDDLSALSTIKKGKNSRLTALGKLYRKRRSWMWGSRDCGVG